MEQEERKELEPTTETPVSEPSAPAPEDGPNAVQKSREQTRRSIVHLVAGGYLLYLSWQLLSAFIGGIGTNGWTGDMIVSLLGGGVFVLVGGYLLYGGIRRLLAELKDKDSRGG